MRKMTIALVVAGLMGFGACSKNKPAATTPENKGGEMGSGSGSGEVMGGSGYGGGGEMPNPCGGGEEMGNPCGGE